MIRITTIFWQNVTYKKIAGNAIKKFWSKKDIYHE